MTEIQKRTAPVTLAAQLHSPAMMDQIRRALPGNVLSEKFARVVLTQLRKVKNLDQTTPQSFFAAVLECAALGLEPGVLGQAWILPFWSNKLGGFEATLIIGYRGMVQLMYRSQLVKSAQAREVYAGERFEYEEGLDRKLIHVPTFQVGVRPSDVVAAYAIIQTTTGGALVEVMNREQIEAVRARSRSKDSGPWVTDWTEMARKTVLRRAAKLAPMSPALQRALDIEDRHERAEGEIDVTPEVELAVERAAAEPGSEDKPAPSTEPERDPETGEIIPEWVGKKA